MAQSRRRMILLATRSPRRLIAAWAALHAQLRHAPSSMREAFRRGGVPCPAPCVFYPSCGRREARCVFSVDLPGPTIRARVRPMPPNYEFRATDASQTRADVFNMRVQHLAALQGFPPGFSWPQVQTSSARSIGNAVPVPLARAIGRAIAAA